MGNHCETECDLEVIEFKPLRSNHLTHFFNVEMAVLVHTLADCAESDIIHRQLEVVIERLEILDAIDLQVVFPEEHENTPKASAVLQEKLKKLLVIEFYRVYEIDAFFDCRRQLNWLFDLFHFFY